MRYFIRKISAVNMKLKQCQPAVTDHRGGLKTLKEEQSSTFQTLHST